MLRQPVLLLRRRDHEEGPHPGERPFGRLAFAVGALHHGGSGQLRRPRRCADDKPLPDPALREVAGDETAQPARRAGDGELRAAAPRVRRSCPDPTRERVARQRERGARQPERCRATPRTRAAYGGFVTDNPTHTVADDSPTDDRPTVRRRPCPGTRRTTCLPLPPTSSVPRPGSASCRPASRPPANGPGASCSSRPASSASHCSCASVSAGRRAARHRAAARGPAASDREAAALRDAGRRRRRASPSSARSSGLRPA